MEVVVAGRLSFPGSVPDRFDAPLSAPGRLAGAGENGGERGGQGRGGQGGQGAPGSGDPGSSREVKGEGDGVSRATKVSR
ncbi:hypothetical protein ACFQX6_01245 [Streptosporangium lutulentum]